MRSHWKLPYSEIRGTAPPDIELVEAPASVFEKAARKASSRPGEEDWFERATLDDHSTYLRWLGMYDFLVSADSRRILSRTIPEVRYESFLVYLLNGALPFALLSLGIDPLHASAVVVERQAIGFLGKSGYGKSTLAGAFLQAGYPLLTDDALVLKQVRGNWLAYPGPPRLKLHPESAAAVIRGRISGVPMNAQSNKLVFPLGRRQSLQAASPIAALYVLNRPRPGAPAPKQPRIQRFSGPRALLALVKNSYNDWVSEPARLKLQFSQYAQIAAKVPVKLLSYPRRMDALASVRDAILEDLGQ